MPTRTTRSKIKDKRRNIFHALDRIEENMKGIYDLADGNSPVVEQVIPPALGIIDGARKMLVELLGNL